MDAMPLYELHKMCRICLKSDLLVSIFSPTFLMRPIEMIEKLNIFKLQPDDNLPNVLCQSCLYRLLDAYNLQQLAEASECRLRDYMCLNGSNECSPNLNLVSQQQESSNLSTVTVINESVPKDVDTTAAIYANICDMFERTPVHPANDIEADGDDVLNDVEIDVSSLTRSEADDTLSEVFNCGSVRAVSADAAHKQSIIGVVELKSCNGWTTNGNKEKNIAKYSQKVLRIPDKCNECGKTFKYSGYLESHKRIHTGEKPFKCKVCEKRFSQSSNLVLHKRIHTGERRFQCETCSSFFTTSSNLKAHRLTHSEQRDFQCQLCNLSFKSMRELRRHEPVHKIVKDIVCGLCQKAFVKRSYLNVHMATVHRNVKRHKCSECDKVFGNRSNLICHLRTHTGEKPFQCQKCPWKFNQSSALVRHMKKHQNNDWIEKNQDNVNNSLLGNCLSYSKDLLEGNISISTTHSDDISIIQGFSSSNAIPTQDESKTTSSVISPYTFTKSECILDFSIQQNQTHDIY